MDSSHVTPSAAEQLHLLTLAQRHPHWCTFEVTVAWVLAGQRAVTDVAVALSGGNVSRALDAMRLPPDLFLWDPNENAFADIPAVPSVTFARRS
jgi:hypothetical protein